MFQKIVLLLLTVSLTKSITRNIRENECSENDVYCMNKKQEMHWCSDQGCSTCTDHNCVMSCNGFSCGLCPNGSCCNGTNCNACYNNTCCFSSSCNYCIHTCKHACTEKIECVASCVPQCQNSSNEIFVVPSSSNKQEAFVYVKGLPYNGNLISGDFRIRETITVSINGYDSTGTVLTLWPAHESENLCTVNNTNLCSKKNVAECLKECQVKCQINCDVYCNSTCSTPKTKEPYYYKTLVPGCCHLVHPPVCYKTYTGTVCYKRSHRECSQLCSSKFIHITPTNGFLKLIYSTCFYVQAYPYVYCGQYQIQNCDSCYVCDGKYNPKYCVNNAMCSNECRLNFFPYDPQNNKNGLKARNACVKPTHYRNPIGKSSLYNNAFNIPSYG